MCSSCRTSRAPAMREGPGSRRPRRGSRRRSGTGAREALPARAGLLEIMGIIAGKWPHSLAFRAGGVAHAPELSEKVRLFAILARFRAFLEKSLFGAPLEAVTALQSAADLDAFVEAPGTRRRLRELCENRARSVARDDGSRSRAPDVRRRLSWSAGTSFPRRPLRRAHRPAARLQSRRRARGRRA